MICDLCKQKHASLFLTKVVDNHVTKLKLCEACAAEKNVGDSLHDDPDIEKLIGELLPLATATVTAGETDDRDDLICSTCGMSYRTFRSKGRLGCEDCYTVFESRLVEVIDEVQKSRQHCGKIAQSRRAEVERLRRIEGLRDSLMMAVNEERYEDAARLRDEIEQLRNKSERGGWADASQRPIAVALQDKE